MSEWLVAEKEIRVIKDVFQFNLKDIVVGIDRVYCLELKESAVQYTNFDIMKKILSEYGNFIEFERTIKKLFSDIDKDPELLYTPSKVYSFVNSVQMVKFWITLPNNFKNYSSRISASRYVLKVIIYTDADVYVSTAVNMNSDALGEK